MDNIKFFFAKRKPGKCPLCGSHKIARIQRGMPVMTEELQAKLDAGKVVLGGCCLSLVDPSWKCIDCNTDIYREELRDQVSTITPFS